MTECSDCAITRSEEGKNWPEGIISVKMTMSPYLLAMATEESLNRGTRLWELINTALWEKLGKPDWDALMRFAADMEVNEEDPKWKKRLKITARHELAVAELRRAMQPGDRQISDSGDGKGGESKA